MYEIVTKPEPPFVYIAGAGPGNLELLTLKTYYLITKVADIVIYDRLIQKDIINLIPEGVEAIYVGKSHQPGSITQDEINSLLLKKAQEKKIILRLKGGDPFIFGRGGEESNYLYENKINFEIIPGISAAEGSAAYCNIPLTHRGVADSVIFVTGHKENNKLLTMDWRHIMSERTTIVVYMGLANLDLISVMLIKHGLSPETPVVIIENGTTEKEKICLSNLKNIYEEAKKYNIQPPAIVIIGEVVLLSNKVKKKAINFKN